MASIQEREEALRARYEELLTAGAANPGDIDANLGELRRLVLIEGLPSESLEERRRGDGEIGLRGRVWKVLLRVRSLDAARYEALVRRGPSKRDGIIMKDAPRTLGNQAEFRQRVTNEKLVRVLNAWQHDHDEMEDGLTYVQGLNLILGVFLYTMPELDAFTAFSILTRDHCHLYCDAQLTGAYQGVDLFAAMLSIMDPELSKHLQRKSLEPSSYAMPAIMSFNANSPPYTELLRLWDVAVAMGFHLHVIFTVARMLLMRKELIASDDPNNDLLTVKRWPLLNARQIVNIGMVMVQSLPEELYTRVLVHPFNVDNTPLTFESNSGLEDDASSSDELEESSDD